MLAPDSNPEGVSIPYVTYSHAAALAELHDVTLVVRSTVEDPVRRAKAQFRTSKWSECHGSSVFTPGVFDALQI